MVYEIEFKPRAMKDLKSIDRRDAHRVLEKIKAMRNDLAGDVKRLTKSTPEYRLRVGAYRALFEVEGDKVVIYRVRHRKDAYS
jgi:mRNA interferase RelE/StbE